MQLAWKSHVVSIPQPIFLVIEDVGWWQGEDGSAVNQPYRNGFLRRHCLEDYQALVLLAEKLQMRLALGMVLGEWDRTNLLRNIPGATWMGTSWDNRINQGPWLDETVQYLRDNKKYLEIALHGLCHEFWQDGRMTRSEFHDSNGMMRPEKIVRSHLEAFGTIRQQNNLTEVPRLFIPPALNHSFGNTRHSMQALLHEYGIRYVVTDFSRARQYSPPLYEKFTWECGVALLERGQAPVSWSEPATLPVWDCANPILPLHWANLLHPDPGRNVEIVNRWADYLLAAAGQPDRVLVKDIRACWQQATTSHLAALRTEGDDFVIDLHGLPESMPLDCRSFSIKIKGIPSARIHCRGARITSSMRNRPDVQTLFLLPETGEKRILVYID